ncbi:MAG: sensor histidine kinase [Micromonosporaceae bacterium]
MSGDIPLAQPTPRLTSASDPDEKSAWQRTFQLFEAYFAVAGCGTIALVLFAPAVALADMAVFALFVLSPQGFMVLRFWPAVGAVAALNGVPPVLILAGTGDVRGVLTVSLPIAALATAVTAFLAASTMRILRYSDQQRALIAELEATRAEVARLSHEAGVAAERQRLAGDLHDTVAQGLSSVVMLVQAAEAELDRSPDAARRHLRLAGRTAREHMAEIRALVAALTPAALAGSSLPDALRRLVGRFTDETGIDARVEISGEAGSLPTAVEVVVLRAAQEALANVRKHADAHQVRVLLGLGPAAVSLEVRDDGRGFVPGEQSGGYGLGAMRSRVQQVGGVLTVDSAPGAGTVLRVEVPR